MDQITHQNQPASHPASLTGTSCIRADQRAAAGNTTRAGAGLATRRGSGPTSSRDPLAPGAALARLPGLLLHVAGRRNRWPGPPRLDDLLAAEPGDAGCGIAFHVLDH